MAKEDKQMANHEIEADRSSNVETWEWKQERLFFAFHEIGRDLKDFKQRVVEPEGDHEIFYKSKSIYREGGNKPPSTKCSLVT